MALKTVTMKPKKAGQKPISFKQGGLHQSLGLKPGTKMTAAQHQRAASGAAGPLAQKQERFFENVLNHHAHKVANGGNHSNASKAIHKSMF